MKKIWLIVLSVTLMIVGVGGFFIWQFFFKPAPSTKGTGSPAAVKKVNELEFSKRPYVALLPHPDPSSCSGVDMVIENLKNNETLAEYELEYNAGPMIQGVFGRRDFTQKVTSHQPLLFGSCSRNKCKCDENITGGKLTLDFTAQEDYSLFSDFTMQIIGQSDKLNSTDARLVVDPGSALPKSTQVIIMNTMGLPGELNGEVILGPYGIFPPKGIVARGEMAVTLQTKEAGKLMFWGGQAWQELKTEINDDKVSGILPNVGVVVLVK
ncbi:hypothetical protein A2160_02260 [Candidatus Beckwithbacteria bacterium RBG_13_42_9]|uniref:Uncharacterized protein n=1 Tax=Candidatus Beckwithbacteria bacterium RBG_13_42_9 TaxID=1797457 RepID=A0A1F5E7A4_9BACT|nr:MAG: hypothetical protein A2160_02260 [Candidatus Beckwithbacteria bacterium RBG_13_42_9]